ncbi:MAG: aminoacyl--tRNA ligase-related protein [Methanoculleus sp.]
MLEYGGMPVETPVMYDLGDRAIAEHAAKFGERQYRFKSGNRDMMLRFAACFGMFSIMHDMHISPNTLPMKLYELSTYSFRHEQKGEVIGLRRLRAFTMPDMHTLCRNMDDALASFEEQVVIGWKSGEDLETPLVGIFRCTRDFFEQYEPWIKGLVAKSGAPMLVEVLSERTHYWIAKADLAAIDAQGRPIENPTVQIDVESADRFDIKCPHPGRCGDPPSDPPLFTDGVDRAGDLRTARERSRPGYTLIPDLARPDPDPGGAGGRTAYQFRRGGLRPPDRRLHQGRRR